MQEMLETINNRSANSLRTKFNKEEIEYWLKKERQQHERTAIDVVNIALDNIGIPDNKMEEKFNEYWKSIFETNKETLK